MPLVQLVVVLIVVGVLLGLVNRYIPMAGSIKSILNGVVVIGVVLWLLNVFGLFPRSRRSMWEVVLARRDRRIVAAQMSRAGFPTHLKCNRYSGIMWFPTNRSVFRMERNRVRNGSQTTMNNSEA